MNKIKFLICFLLSFELLQAQAQENKNGELINYLKTNWSTPENYVISKFRDHDYVFIGEYHRIKQDVDLINNLIPRLYKNHIYNLGIEFGLYECQSKVDSLINAPVFDRKLVETILFKYSPLWGYKEYIDLYKSAWEVNHSSNTNTNKFRIINLGNKFDPYMKDHFNGIDGDIYMASIILKEIVSKNQKALIYSGSHHAFTKYHQPVYNIEKGTLYRFDTKRMGNIIYNSLKEKTFNINLHAAWVSYKGYDSLSVLPVNGVIDSVMNHFSDKRVGFDVLNSPFGKLTANDTYYAFGYPDFTLDTFCDGYIYLNAFKNYQPITMEEGFITKDNLGKLKDYIKCFTSDESGIKNLSVENANNLLFEDIRKHFAHLMK